MKNKKVILVGIMLVFATIIFTTTVNADGEWIVSIDPATQNVVNGSYVEIDIIANITGGTHPISGWEIEILNFTASKLNLNAVTEGNWMSDVQSSAFNAGTINNTAGTLEDTYCFTLMGGVTNSNGTLCTLNFTAEQVGIATIDYVIDLSYAGESQSFTPVYGNITVFSDVAPEIVDNSPEAGTTGDFFLFNVTVTDDVDSATSLTVKVNWSHGGGWTNDTMAHAGGNYFTKQITLNHAITDLYYYIYANDTYPNSNMTIGLSASVTDNDAPTLVLDGSDSTGTTGDTFHFVVDLADNIDAEGSLPTVKVAWSQSGGSSSNDTMAYSGGHWIKNITVSSSSIGSITYFFYVLDSASNKLHASGSSPAEVSDNDAPALVDDGSDTSATTGEVFHFVLDLSDNIVPEANMPTVKVNYTQGAYTANYTMAYSTGSWRAQFTVNDSVSNIVYFFYVLDNASNKLHSSGDSPVSVTDNDAPTNTSDPVVDEPFTDLTKIFGIDWVNITCELTDNIAITGAYLNITHNSTNYENNSIFGFKSGDTYYNNATHPTIGTYSIFIHGYDAASNTVNTGSVAFTIYYKWDQNQDNEVDINDVTSITGQYGNSGTGRWIKQDISPATPDGDIDINDITAVTGHYGEEY